MKKYGIIALLLVVLSSLGGTVPSLTFAEESEVGQAEQAEQDNQANQVDLIDQVISEVKDALVLCVDSSKVYIEGQQGRIDPNHLEITPFVEDGTTFVPLKFLSEQLGGTMSWSSKTKETTIAFNGNTARTKLGEAKLYIDDRAVAMSAPGKTVNGTTYLPLRNVVEDIFQKELFYKDGIILISNEAKTYSDSTLAGLSKTLKPYVVYSAGSDLLYIYADGTRNNKEIEYEYSTEPRITGTSENSFYIEDHNYRDQFFHKMDLQGEIVQTFKTKWGNGMALGLAKEGVQYYSSAQDNIYKVSENDITNPKVIGKGYFAKDDAFVKGETFWFTNQTDDDHAIYKLHNGKRTKISKNNSFLKYVHDNWIYYGYYENKRWTLYRMTMDGGQKTKLTGDADVWHSVIYNQKIYYLDNHSKVLREMNLDGSNKRVVCKLSKQGEAILEFGGGFIYFTEENQDGPWTEATQALYKVSLSKGTKQQLVDVPLEFSHFWQRIENVAVIGGVVYYSLDNRIYAVEGDGSKPKEIQYMHGSYLSEVFSLKIQ
ncbi:DUF5050 domain-containing protein [Fontibacillus sp. BL9]|uniref:DUF5050 domain-containing protein n=1 Tax=Fontibacillus sp. BL9 TaxID=3389971 RepID=UPI00397B7A40